MAVSQTPSSNATMREAVLNTEPGSIRSLTAWFFISRYSPSTHFSMLTIALISPVFTSITMATPELALISLSLFIIALSAKSCMLTSMVVMISLPLIGGVSVILRYLFNTFLLLTIPVVPRNSESYDNSSPQRGVRPSSFAANMSPTVRPASVPYGRSRAFNSSSWKPLCSLESLKTGSIFTSLYVL